MGDGVLFCIHNIAPTHAIITIINRAINQPFPPFTSNFKDLHTKAEKAIYTPGAAFLNIMAPCPRGWRYNTPDIMEICKLAVETCYWPLFEVVDGEYKLSYRPKAEQPNENFLKPQGRFKHLFKKGNEHLIPEIQAEVDKRWEELLKLCGEEV